MAKTFTFLLDQPASSGVFWVKCVLPKDEN
jgi:hypothetical protein